MTLILINKTARLRRICDNRSYIIALLIVQGKQYLHSYIYICTTVVLVMSLFGEFSHVRSKNDVEYSQTQSA